MESVAEPRPHPVVGTQLVRSWKPVGEPAAEVVLVHGLSDHTGRYERTARLLAEAGFFVTGPDLIGWGGTGGRRGDVRDWSLYLDQVQSFVESARETGRPVVLLGHSMGALLALEYTLSERPHPDLLVLSAPSLKGGAGWQRRLAVMLGKLLPVVALPTGITGDQLSRDPAVGEAYSADPLVDLRATIRLGNLLFAAMDRTRNACTRLQVPTLLLHGGHDSVVPSSCTVQLGALACVERRFYPHLRHEIFNEPEGPEVVAEVIDWIVRRLAAIR